MLICSKCGKKTPTYNSRCPSCLAENSLVKIQTPTKDTLLLGYTPHDAAVFSTGFPVFDKLIGGGLRPGGTYFLYAPPGTGKTTLLLQIAANIIGGEK